MISSLVRPGLASLGAAAALTAGAVSPASAAEGDTTTTFALAGSALSISVQPTATLTGGAAGDTSVNGQLGQVQVTDLRGGTSAWSAKATSTTFTNGGTGDSLTTSTGVSYNSGAITTTGTIVIVPKGAKSLSGTPIEVAAPTSVIGNNTARWNPTLTVTLPSNSLAGTYTGTVNTSVL